MTLAGTLPSSLVLKGESVDENVCPRNPYWLVCDQDPQLRFPASCDSYKCPTCGPRKAREAVSVMAWGAAQTRARFVTLTLAPENWQQRRQKVRDLRRLLRRRGFRWEFAWSTELGSETGMVHVHGLQHGDYVPQAVLQDVWGAIVDIRAVRTPRGAAGYALKEAARVAGYAMKGSRVDVRSVESTPPADLADSGGKEDPLRAHLDLNGGRAAHWSRGYLHGQDKRGALAAVRSSGREGLTWRLEPGWVVPSQTKAAPATPHTLS